MKILHLLQQKSVLINSTKSLVQSIHQILLPVQGNIRKPKGTEKASLQKEMLICKSDCSFTNGNSLSEAF